MTMNYDDETLGIERTARWLGEPQKSPYIPTWYQPHSDLERMVTYQGKPQGLTIRQVLPYRRWAVDTQGVIIAQNEFEQLYQRYLSGYKMDKGTNVQSEHIPNVLTFVRAKQDHLGNLVDFAFQDDGSVVKTGRFTQEGEEAPEYLLREKDTAQNEGAMRALLRLKQSGKLSAEQFAEEVESLIGPHDAAIIEAAPGTKPYEAKPLKRVHAARPISAAHVQAMALGREKARLAREAAAREKPPGDAA